MSRTSKLTWNLIILGLKALKEAGHLSYPWKRDEPISVREFQSALILPVSGRVAGTVTVTPYENLSDRASLTIDGRDFKASCTLYQAGGMYGISDERFSKRGRFAHLPKDLFELTKTDLPLELIF